MREKIGGFSAYDLSVRKLQSGSRAIGCFFFFEGSRNNLTVSDLCMSLLEKKLDFTYLILCAGAGNQSVHALIITADDLLAGSSWHTSSSTMQLPAMLTPISVGDL